MAQEAQAAPAAHPGSTRFKHYVTRDHHLTHHTQESLTLHHNLLRETTWRQPPWHTSHSTQAIAEAIDDALEAGDQLAAELVTRPAGMTPPPTDRI